MLCKYLIIPCFFCQVFMGKYAIVEHKGTYVIIRYNKVILNFSRDNIDIIRGIHKHAKLTRNNSFLWYPVLRCLFCFFGIYCLRARKQLYTRAYNFDTHARTTLCAGMCRIKRKSLNAFFLLYMGKTYT